MKRLICAALSVALLLVCAACGAPSAENAAPPAQTPAASPSSSPAPEATPSAPASSPSPSVEPAPAPSPSVEPTPSPSVEPMPAPAPSVEPTPSLSVEPAPAPSPSIEPAPSPTPTLHPSPEPTPSAEPTPAPDPLPSYDPLIDTYKIPFTLGSPQYSVDEIRQMIGDNLSLDEVAARLSTLADVVQYLHQKGYGEAGGDLEVEYSNTEWHLSRSAQTVFSENRGNCGDGSNLINYLLRGDFDEQGYVQESANQGGHVYNYFKQDGVYYFFDMIQIVHGGDYSNKSYRVFETTEPKEFSSWYISRNHSREENDALTYLLFQYMYAWEGSSLPIGSNSQCKTVLGRQLMNILSDEIEGNATILYVAEDKYTPVLKDAPPKDFWPANAR